MNTREQAVDGVKRQFGTHRMGWRILRGLLGAVICATGIVIQPEWTLPGWDAVLEMWKPSGTKAAEWLVFALPVLGAFLTGTITGAPKNGVEGGR